jgi:hypothetical protein
MRGKGRWNFVLASLCVISGAGTLRSGHIEFYTHMRLSGTSEDATGPESRSARQQWDLVDGNGLRSWGESSFAKGPSDRPPHTYMWFYNSAYPKGRPHTRRIDWAEADGGFVRRSLLHDRISVHVPIGTVRFGSNLISRWVSP